MCTLQEYKQIDMAKKQRLYKIHTLSFACYSFSLTSDLLREREILENKLLACKERTNMLNDELSIRIRYVDKVQLKEYQ